MTGGRLSGTDHDKAAKDEVSKDKSRDTKEPDKKQ